MIAFYRICEGCSKLTKTRAEKVWKCPYCGRRHYLPAKSPFLIPPRKGEFRKTAMTDYVNKVIER